MIDVVYPLGHGSTWSDNELRFSLRSLRQYVTGLRDVYVIGMRPAWLRNVVHIPYPDRHACKERNIMEKVLRACQEPALSESFLFANDDHFALGHCEASQLPIWRSGLLEDLGHRLPGGSHYRQAVLNTAAALQLRGHSAWNFDVHTPILYDKELFPLAMACYDWELHRGYVVKSLYANSVGCVGAPMGDLKLTQRYTPRQLLDFLRPRLWWSIGPSALNLELKAMLFELYPEPSLHE